MKFKVLIPSIIIFIGVFSCTDSPNLTTTTSQYFDLARQNFTGDVAFETTEFVEKYWRVAGNTGFNATINRIAAKLEEAGYILEANATPNDILTYRIEKREMEKNTWEPVDASLTILGNNERLLEYSSNRNMIFKNSSSTPPEGVIGEVVYIANKEALTTADIKGKIVFAEMSPYTLYKEAIVEGGAIGLITYDNPSYLQPEKNTTSIQFRSLPYSKTIKTWGIALSYEAKETLKAAVLNGKVKLKVDIKTKIYPSEELTIIANIIGSEIPNESFVFSAHIQEPGANDNASGVGAQLEMAMVSAKLINAKKLSAKRTLTFLWGDEIFSTRRYIKEKEKRNAEINWGISLDMVGENTSLTGGSFLIEKMPDPSAIWTRGNDKHTEWGGKTLALEDMKPHYLNDFIIEIFKNQGAYAKWEVNTNPFEGGSDHIPFLKADIPGLLLWHFTDQFYHTDNDRIDMVSQETLKNVSISALVSAYTLINADYTTARQVIQTILNAAEKRLNNEFVLSKKAITNGKLVADETKILTAWNNWYLDALGSIEDLVPESCDELKDEISEAQITIQTTTDNLIQELNK
ncbi:M28 family peptidase [Fulvivirga lutimaris]|uniref:M28 family peptidase n=1 Tax=Fulvivirga lutimaris TaxID=1819566 RepID=UPI0012BC7332|nr:M28 family peptidase [Fulvivirga lutimaris]MTI40227.1 M28 family peptidase [Fulvivirga lutimaris]